MLNKFYTDKKLPNIPVYVDSPLAINATEIFKLNLNLFNDDVAETLETDSNPFGFNTLFYINNAEMSKRLNSTKQPCIIISASGMMEAGRVKHHIANNVDSSKNSILSVGYCAPDTLGAKILRGDKDISIFGFPHQVNAEIYSIDAFSGHGDYKELEHYVKCQNPKQLKKLFIVHGEYEAQKFYADVLKKDGFTNIEIPEAGSVYEL